MKIIKSIFHDQTVQTRSFEFFQKKKREKNSGKEIN